MEQGDRLLTRDPWEITCHEVKEGNKLWSFPVVSPTRHPGAIAIGANIFLYAAQGQVVRLNQKNGEVLKKWEYVTPEGYDLYLEKVQIHLSSDETAAVFISDISDRKSSSHVQVIFLDLRNQETNTLFSQRMYVGDKNHTFRKHDQLYWRIGRACFVLNLDSAHPKLTPSLWPHDSAPHSEDTGSNLVRYHDENIRNRNHRDFSAVIYSEPEMSVHHLEIGLIGSKEKLFSVPRDIVLMDSSDDYLYFQEFQQSRHHPLGTPGPIKKIDRKGNVIFQHEAQQNSDLVLVGFNKRGMLLRGKFSLMCVNENSFSGPNYEANSYLNQGVCLLELNSPKEALGRIEKSLALSPSNPEVHYQKARSLSALVTQSERSQKSEYTFRALLSYDRSLDFRSISESKKKKALSFLAEQGAIKKRVKLPAGQLFYSNGDFFYFPRIGSKYDFKGRLEWKNNVLSRNADEDKNNLHAVLDLGWVKYSYKEGYHLFNSQSGNSNKLDVQGTPFKQPYAVNANNQREYLPFSDYTPAKEMFVSKDGYLFSYSLEKDSLQVFGTNVLNTKDSWKVTVEEHNIGDPWQVIYSQDRLLVGFSDGSQTLLLFLDLQEKEVLWHKVLPYRTENSLCQIIFNEEIIFFAPSGQGLILMLSAENGSLVKQQPIKNIAHPITILDSPPLTLFANSASRFGNTKPIAFNSQTGEEVSSFPHLKSRRTLVEISRLEDQVLLTDFLNLIKVDGEGKVIRKTIRSNGQSKGHPRIKFIGDRTFLHFDLEQENRVYELEARKIPDVWFYE